MQQVPIGSSDRLMTELCQQDYRDSNSSQVMRWTKKRNSSLYVQALVGYTAPGKQCDRIHQPWAMFISVFNRLTSSQGQTTVRVENKWRVVGQWRISW